MQLLTRSKISFVYSVFLPDSIWGREYIHSILDHLPASTQSSLSQRLLTTKEQTSHNKLRANFLMVTNAASFWCMQRTKRKQCTRDAGQIRVSSLQPQGQSRQETCRSSEGNSPSDTWKFLLHMNNGPGIKDRQYKVMVVPLPKKWPHNE